MNGIIHAEWFRDKVLSPIGLAQFYPYSAASTAARAMQNPIITFIYGFGVLACVYHFANGLWTMGITWGVWVSPKAQALASKFCLGLGVIVAGLGMSAIVGLWNIDVEAAQEREIEMYEQRVKDGSILENDHKVYGYPVEEHPEH